MTIAPFSSLVPDVALSAAGCPDAVIEGHIRQSAIRTCERAHYWRALLPEMLLTPGVWTYKFVGMPPQSEVFTLMGASLNDRHIAILPPDVMACCYPAWEDTAVHIEEVQIAFADAVYNVPEYDDDTTYNSMLATATAYVEVGSQPQAIGRLNPCEFITLPKPDGETAYFLRPYVALRPKKDATGMDECVLDDLREVIVHGALETLHLLPGTHWTDRDLGAYHAKQYTFKVTERRARSNLGFSRGALVAHPQPFGV